MTARPLAALLVTAGARAATITVDTTAEGFTTDGACSLAEAIEAANTNAAVDSCPSGEGLPATDVVGLSAETYTLTAAVDVDATDGDTGLPRLTEDAILAGVGADATIIERDGAAAASAVAAAHPSPRGCSRSQSCWGRFGAGVRRDARHRRSARRRRYGDCNGGRAV